MRGNRYRDAMEQMRSCGRFVRQPSGATIFLPRTQVEDSSPQDWSLMPEDAAAGMSAGELADLIEFITLPR